MVAHQRPMSDDDRGGLRLLAPALAWVAAVALAVAVVEGPLGNDEAQYAMGARALVGGAGDDVDPYPRYRSIGMPVLSAPGALAGEGDLAMRAPFVPFALAYLALVGWLARRAGGGAAAALAVAVQVSAGPWLARTGEGLSDIPSATLVLAMIALMVGGPSGARAGGPRGRRRRRGTEVARWTGVALCGAAAIHVRHGNAPLVALVALVGLVVLRGRRRAVALSAAGVGLLMLPFLLWSEATTGSFLGVLRAGETAAARAYVGEGLGWYASRWLTEVCWPVMGAMSLLGIAAGWRAWTARDAVGGRDAAADDPPVATGVVAGHPGAAVAAGDVRRLLSAVALGYVVAIGLVVHGEARFVFFSASALTITGAAALAPRLRARAQARTAAVLVLALSTAAAGTYAVARAAHVGRGRAEMVAAAALIRADVAAAARGAPGTRCLVYTGTRPQVAWYTGCRTLLVGEVPIAPFTADGHDRVYVLSAAHQPRQPSDGARLSAPGLVFRTLACGDGWCVWRARPPL